MDRSPRPSNVEIRADDPALTGHAGLLLTGEVAARTKLVARLDRVGTPSDPSRCVGAAAAVASCWSRWRR